MPLKTLSHSNPCRTHLSQVKVCQLQHTPLKTFSHSDPGMYTPVPGQNLLLAVKTTENIISFWPRYVYTYIRSKTATCSMHHWKHYLILTQICTHLYQVKVYHLQYTCVPGQSLPLAVNSTENMISFWPRYVHTCARPKTATCSQHHWIIVTSMIINVYKLLVGYIANHFHMSTSKHKLQRTKHPNHWGVNRKRTTLFWYKRSKTKLNIIRQCQMLNSLKFLQGMTAWQEQDSAVTLTQDGKKNKSSVISQCQTIYMRTYLDNIIVWQEEVATAKVPVNDGWFCGVKESHPISHLGTLKSVRLR